jgi:hypothetical protein
MIINGSGPWEQRDVEQAVSILNARFPEGQAERALELCSSVAANARWTLTYAAMCAVKITLDNGRSVITVGKEPS